MSLGALALVVGGWAATQDLTGLGPEDARAMLGSQLAVVAPEAHDSDDDTITTIPVGTNVHLAAKVVGAFGTPTGTVRIRAYSDGVCGGFIQKESSAITLSGGSMDGGGFVYSQMDAGAMSFIVHYSGNATYAATDSFCLKVTVTKVAPSKVELRVHTPQHAVPVQVELGTLVHVWVGVGGTKDTVTGSVRHAWWQNGNCFGDATFAYTSHTLVNGVAHITSPTTASNVLGTFSFRARYLGDTTYSAMTGDCVEYLVVKARPTVTGTIHAADHEPEQAIAIGKPAHPSLTLAGAAGTPTGSVRIDRYQGATCNGTATSQTVPAAATIDPAGSAFTRDTPGSMSWRIWYLGDAKYVQRQSGCLTIRWKDLPEITAVVHDADHDPDTTVAPGEPVHLRVTVSPGVSGTPVTGNVAVYFYANGNCPGSGGINQGTDALENGLVDTAGIDAAPDDPGTYELVAVYQGDANYAGKRSACKSFTVAVPATQAPEATAAPTKTPTPTAKPTKTPTPTAKPTKTPTPTAKPTKTPAPTAKPAAAPTASPSTSPTVATSPSPSPVPSPEPATSEPTASATEPAASVAPSAGASEPATNEPGATGPAATSPPIGGSAGDAGSTPVWILLLVAILAIAGGFVIWSRRGRSPARRG